MKPLIKWPGGKTRELTRIQRFVPDFDRYIEPFFGGGALFFHLKPARAAINDVSPALMDFYALVARRDRELYETLLTYDHALSSLLRLCAENYDTLQKIFHAFNNGENNEALLRQNVETFTNTLLCGSLLQDVKTLCPDLNNFQQTLCLAAADKIKRTAVNCGKRPFLPDDLKKNLLTGYASGFYLANRNVYNDYALKRQKPTSAALQAANFYFVREYCYGSMFRYNGKGEFNIPYGGISYNHKDLKAKIEHMYSEEIHAVFQNTSFSRGDFEAFLGTLNLTKRDFIFLDPPYDTDFSDYEGKAFTKADQERLAELLKRTPARFLLVIKNTEFIYNLYKEDFFIQSFENQYTYNVRSRNQRKVEHLLITNYPVEEKKNAR